MNKPIIDGPDRHDFHDSCLLDIKIDPKLSKIVIVISTPDENENQHVWEISFNRVVSFEFETVGQGYTDDMAPIEIYDIFYDEKSEEYNRWSERFRQLEGEKPNDLYHIVLASSYYGGWGKNSDKEGPYIICRGWSIDFADKKYEKLKFSRPCIEAGDD